MDAKSTVRNPSDLVETWRVINDFPNYSISNIGRIKNNKTGCFISTRHYHNGYVRANITIGSRKSKKIGRAHV